MKLFLLILIFSFQGHSAERDCLKEAIDFDLAIDISQRWSAELDSDKVDIEKICSKEDDHLKDSIMLNKIILRKARNEMDMKHTITMGADDSYFNYHDLEGEVSYQDICKELDQTMKMFDGCDVKTADLKSFKDFEYKNYKKLCLQKLPLQKKRLDHCRKYN